MLYLITKYAVTSAIVVAVSEIAKRSGRLGAPIGALPLVAVLALIWMHVERQPAGHIGTYATYTFWYVLPTLPMFLAFAPLLQRFGFAAAMLAFCVGTLAIFLAFAVVMRRFGIQLL